MKFLPACDDNGIFIGIGSLVLLYDRKRKFAIPIKLMGKIGDHDSRVGVEADLTSLKLDNILPGWVKVPGKAGKATFSVVKKDQSTVFQDIVVDGTGAVPYHAALFSGHVDYPTKHARPVRASRVDGSLLAFP